MSNMTTKTIEDLVKQGQAARAAARQVARLSTLVKNSVLLGLADFLESEPDPVLVANEEDYAAAKSDGLDEAMLDRLLLDQDRLKAVAGDLRKVAELPDPVGESLEMNTLPCLLYTSDAADE